MHTFRETDDEEEKLVKNLKGRFPLVVEGRNTVIRVNSKRGRGEWYPWGTPEVENSEHWDFITLRNILIRAHMQDLKDVPNNVHSEHCRSRKLAAVTYNRVDSNEDCYLRALWPKWYKKEESM